MHYQIKLNSKVSARPYGGFLSRTELGKLKNNKS